MQYLLDNCATIDQVVDECSSINIRTIQEFEWDLHYFVVDNAGQATVIEFIGGNLVVTTGANLEKKAITNSSYEESIDYYHTGKNPSLAEVASLNRYYNAVSMIDAYNNEDLLDYSYSIMEVVTQRITERSMVYDIPNRRVNFKSSGNGNLRYFNLSNFDFSCNQQPKVYIESGSDAGDISNLSST